MLSEIEAGEKHLHYHRLVHKHWLAQAARTEEVEGAAQSQPVSAHAQMAWTSTPARAETPDRERDGQYAVISHFRAFSSTVNGFVNNARLGRVPI